MSEATAESTTPTPLLEIIEDGPTSLEICDACGPSAYAVCRVILPNGGVLTFCAHHAYSFGFSTGFDSHPTEENRTQGSSS